MWKLNIDFLNSKDAKGQDEVSDGTEIEGATWQQVPIKGKFPPKLAHHQGVLQEFTNEFIIYGGIRGIESSDSIYVVDLRTFTFTEILAAQQKEINGKALPGPRDDFSFITSLDQQSRTKPVFLVGGFKNGSKMNDVYKMNQNGQVFTWELIEVASPKPEPRSGFASCLATDTSFYLFGGSGDNNVKYNDLWQFDGAQWVQLTTSTPMGSDVPAISD